jgi:hypothetical protein
MQFKEEIEFINGKGSFDDDRNNEYLNKYKKNVDLFFYLYID